MTVKIYDSKQRQENVWSCFFLFFKSSKPLRVENVLLMAQHFGFLTLCLSTKTVPPLAEYDSDSRAE